MLLSTKKPLPKLIGFQFVLLLFFTLPSKPNATNLWLGILFKTSTSTPKELSDIGYDFALEVAKVLPKSGALEADLRSGDLIIGVNDKILKSKAQIKKQLDLLKVNDRIVLRIYREGEFFNAKVPLKARPDDISQLTGSAIGSKKPYQPELYANKNALQTTPKLVLLDFWATWCQPCRVTSKILNEVYAELRFKGLEVIGISSEPTSKLEDFEKEYPSNYPMGSDVSGRISKSYGVSQIPTLFLLDADGYILQVWKGVPDKNQLKSKLERLLN